MEVTCYKSSEEVLKRAFVNRWSVKFRPDFSPMEPFSRNASPEIKTMVKGRYLDRMLRLANREADLNHFRRRVFGEYYLKAGGKKSELKELEDRVIQKEVNSGSGEEGDQNGKDKETGEEQRERRADSEMMDEDENAGVAASLIAK